MTEYEPLVVTDVAHDPTPEHTSRFDSVGLRSDYGCLVPEWRSKRGVCANKVRWCRKIGQVAKVYSTV